MQQLDRIEVIGKAALIAPFPSALALNSLSQRSASSNIVPASIAVGQAKSKFPFA